MNEEKIRQRPKSTVFKGAAIASLVVAFVYSGYFGTRLQSGIGVFGEFLIGLLVCALGVLLLGLLHALLVFIGRLLPRLFKGDFFAALGSIFKALPIPSTSAIWGSAMYLLLLLVLWYNYPFPFAFIVGPFIVIIEALLGGAIGFIAAGGFKKIGLVKKILVGVQIFLLLLFNLHLVLWFSGSGSDTHLIKYETHVPAHLEKQEAPDPSLPGNYEVGTLIYGSGTDIKRPEYGKDVDIKTKPVDASVILKVDKGFKAKARNWYWGFDVKKFPVNGRVWYPKGEGPFPLVLIVHGNHNMHDYSDPGYAYLGELLSSQGFITVSVDENFFNGGFIGGIPAKKSENAARGWFLLQHLETWKSFNQTEGNVFFGKVDMDNLALIGHSRGGEAVAHAAAQNRLPRFTDDGNLELGFNFNIKTIIAIAPVDGQYRPSQKPLPLENVNYFSIQGSHDADMSSFHGNRQYQRVRFTNQDYRCKATLYIYRANHGQFNTGWGRTDFSPPASWFLNLEPLLPMEEQLKISKLYLSAFLQATIQGKKEYLAMFRNHRQVVDWLPKTIYVNRFEDSTFRKITDFEEDINPLTGSAAGVSLMGEHLAVWSEDRLEFRHGSTQENHVVRLGWKNDEKDKSDESQSTSKDTKESKPEIAKYSITLTEEFVNTQNVSDNTLLVFSMTDTGEEPPEPEEDEQEEEKENAEKNEKKPGEKPDEKKDEEEEEEEEEEKEPLDLTLELVDANGNSARLPLSYFSTLHPPLKVTFTKWPMFENFAYEKSTEPLLETFEFPLKAFKEANPDFETEKLEKIIFLFDKGSEGVIYLDEIGLREEI
jgi:dienelactone hydrolase